MRYFEIDTIRQSIERLQEFNPNWLLTSFVLAANGVSASGFVDISQRLGTDQFLDRYFNARRVGVPAYPTGNNLLRPRLKGMKDWVKGPFAGDYMIRQDTKLWANMLSSRGYRDMRLEGLLEGEKSVAKLTAAFQPRFETEIANTFRFEDLLVWIFAFEGFPDEVTSWDALLQHLLKEDFKLDKFPAEFQGRFTLSNPEVPWPNLLVTRPTDAEFLEELAPKLANALNEGEALGAGEITSGEGTALPPDDAVLSRVQSVITAQAGYAFLFAGPPGTGKTRYARRVANALTDGENSRLLFVQFHPALGYDDFIEGFRPEATSGQGVQYSLDLRLFMRFAANAKANPSKNYVVVIDELNRGDVARIFGEVLTYLEPDYRDTSFTLSFSGKETTLPKNLIVIATANPFDRSVTDLDDALLRRFWVIEMGPDRSYLQSHLEEAEVEKAVVNRALRLFDIMNDALPAGFGHTSLLGVRTVEDIASIWMGRLRLMLRRALIADRVAYDTAASSIETLISVQNEAGEVAEGGGE